MTKSDRRSLTHHPLTCPLASSTLTPTASLFTQSSLLTTSETEFPVVRVIYDFTPTSPFELAVHGQSICIHWDRATVLPH